VQNLHLKAAGLQSGQQVLTGVVASLKGAAAGVCRGDGVGAGAAVLLVILLVAARPLLVGDAAVGVPHGTGGRAGDGETTFDALVNGRCKRGAAAKSVA